MAAIRLLLAMSIFVLSTPTASAHYHMLLPSSVSVRKGETVTLRYQWGHPFEHQLFDAPLPASLFVLAPDGQKTDLTKTIVKDGEGQHTVFQLRFTPPQRGDYLFVLDTPLIWMDEEQEFYQDTVKVVLHVQAQKGWDRSAGKALEMTPLTRPYGLLPGTVFQVQGRYEAKPLAGVLIESERYNETPPKQLPADEFITRTARTDPNGIGTCTLPEAGWWCLTAGQRTTATKERDGKAYPVRRRATFWAYVDEKPRPARRSE